MFVLHKELVLGGADGAARSLQASLLIPPPLRGPIAEFVSAITQLALPWRPQTGISCGWVLRCLVKVLASFVPHFGEHYRLIVITTSVFQLHVIPDSKPLFGSRLAGYR